MTAVVRVPNALKDVYEETPGRSEEFLFVPPAHPSVLGIAKRRSPIVVVTVEDAGDKVEMWAVPERGPSRLFFNHPIGMVYIVFEQSA